MTKTEQALTAVEKLIDTIARKTRTIITGHEETDGERAIRHVKARLF